MTELAQRSTSRGASYYALPGFIGTSFVAFGALGVGWYPLSADPLRWPLINFLETQTAGIALSRSFLIVGAALLLQAWLMVGVDALKGLITSTKDLFIVLAAWGAPFLFIPPLFSRDVYSYYMQGRLQLAGYSPYTTGVATIPGWFTSGVDPLWGDAKTPYGPLFLFIEKTIAQITEPSALKSVLLFRICSVAGLILMCACIPPLARMHGLNPAPVVWLAVMNPLILFHFIAGAHNDSLMIGFVLLSLLLALRKKLIRAVACAATAIAIKPVAFVVIPFIGLLWLAFAVRRHGWASIFTRTSHPVEEEFIHESSHYSFLGKVCFVIAAFIGAFALLSFYSLLAGVHPLGWLSALTTPGSVRSWLAPSSMVGILCASFFHMMGFPNHVDGIVRITHAIGEVLLLIGLVYIVDTVHRRSITRSVGLAFIVLVFCSPAVQPWYLLWFIPLLAITGLKPTHLRIIVTVISVFTIHDIASSAETSDTFLGVNDTIAIVLAVVILILAVVLSPKERRLILGEPQAEGIRPKTDDEIATWHSMRFE
mgnify:CR=1 FL=1